MACFGKYVIYIPVVCTRKVGSDWESHASFALFTRMALVTTKNEHAQYLEQKCSSRYMGGGLSTSPKIC